MQGPYAIDLMSLGIIDKILGGRHFLEQRLQHYLRGMIHLGDPQTDQLAAIEFLLRCFGDESGKPSETTVAVIGSPCRWIGVYVFIRMETSHDGPLSSPSLYPHNMINYRCL